MDGHTMDGHAMDDHPANIKPQRITTIGSSEMKGHVLCKPQLHLQQIKMGQNPQRHAGPTDCKKLHCNVFKNGERNPSFREETGDELGML